MVALIYTFARIIAFTALAPLALGAVLPHAQEQNASIYPRGETWEQYDQTSLVLARDGYCRAYLDTPTRPGVDGLWPCRQNCTGEPFLCSGDKSGDRSTFFRNPDGQQYIMGKCECGNNAAALAISLAVSVGLRDLDNVICAVWLQAFKEAISLGAWVIPGGAEAGAVAKAALRIVKSIKSVDKYGGKKMWVDFVEKQCHIEDWEVVNKAFELGSLVKSL